MEKENTLSKFIGSERERFAGEDNNRFAFSFSQISRYYEFVEVIVDTYKSASQQFVANTRAHQESFLSGSHKVSDTQMLILKEGWRVNLLVHLEIESFYLFSKILLDKISHSVEFYFGPARGHSFDSHDNLCKYLASYAEQKGLTLPQDFIKLATELKTDVSDYRDYEIAHEKSPRRISGTIFDADGKPRIVATNLYPKEKDQQVESKALEDLHKRIDEYINQVIILIRSNADKTRLQVEPGKV
jgi:hypothetical protein